MKSTIITLACDGQMCNQLMTLAASLANGLEKNSNVICPVMNEDLKKYFEFNFSHYKEIKVVMCHSEALYKFSKTAGRVAHRISRNNQIQIKLPGYRYVFFLDWISFKDDNALLKHLVEIRDYFRFKTDIENRCRDLITENCGYNLKTALIGVHARRGDYRSFHNGDYYFDDRLLARQMKYLNWSKESKFVLFSNEKIDLDYFRNEGLEVYNWQGSATDDLCCLSMCDYIMGPPSTYSWWASMYGNKQRLIMTDKSVLYDWSDFMFLEDRLALKVGGVLQLSIFFSAYIGSFLCKEVA